MYRDRRCNRQQLTPVDNPHDVVARSLVKSLFVLQKKTPIVRAGTFVVRRSVRAFSEKENKTEREVNIVVREALSTD
jgi:hypothetical protein